MPLLSTGCQLDEPPSLLHEGHDIAGRERGIVEVETEPEVEQPLFHRCGRSSDTARAAVLSGETDFATAESEADRDADGLAGLPPPVDLFSDPRG